MANVLLKRWKLVAGLPLTAVAITAIVVFIVPAQYTATTTFVPETGSRSLNLPSGLVGLASQFGVSVPGGEGLYSPAFYADVLKSRTLNDQLLFAAFPDPRTPAPTDSAALLDILGIESEAASERLETGRRELKSRRTIVVDRQTSVVSLSVETRYRTLSADVANHLIDLLNQFNLETQRTHAQERRRFIEERMAEAQRELHEAEEELERWLEQNRRYRESPELTFQHDRLQRQITIKQEVFTTLRRQYEEARIQEVNNTPVITVIDRAVAPQEKSSPKRKLNVLLAFLLGVLLSVVGAFGREFLEQMREGAPQEYLEFRSNWAAIGAELRSVVSRVGRSR